jgi:hypothetical protein
MARATFLAAVLRRNGNENFAKYLSVVLQPFKELSPGSITDAFGKAMIFDHVTHHQLLKHHQIVRFDYASCQLHGKIFTLARDFEVFFSQLINRFSAFIRTFYLSTYSSLQTFKSFFRLSQMARIFNFVTSIVSVEVHQPNIKSHYLLGRLNFFKSGNGNTELSVIPICSTDNSNSLNLFGLIIVQIESSNQAKATSLKTIGESDRASIFRMSFKLTD